MENINSMIPKPLGDKAVGIRIEEFTNMGRRLPITIYYPAESKGTERYPYAFEEVFSNEQILMRYPKDLEKIKTYCYESAEISTEQESFPVVIFNHGYTCYEMANTVLCSDLASKGYIVVSCSHPNDASAVKLLDGTIIPFNNSTIKDLSEEYFESIAAVVNEVKKAENDEEVINKSKEYYDISTHLDEIIETWVNDSLALVDYLENCNGRGFWNGKLKLDLGIAATGHSLGGATAIILCEKDKRFACGINLDGGTYGGKYKVNINKPFLTMGTDELWFINRGCFIRNSKDSFHIVVNDAGHMGFADHLFINRGMPTEELGSRDPNDFRRMISEYHEAFFKKYLLKATDKFIDLGYENTEFYQNLN